MSALLLLVGIFLSLSNAALHPAKGQTDLSFRDVCGTGGVDCKNGYCCYTGQLCVANDPPMCRDLLLYDWSMEAVDYTSFINLVGLKDLTSLGLTLSNIPRTLTFSTTLPTYTDNPIPPQYTPPAFRTDLLEPTQASTGGATLPTIRKEVLVGGVMCAGVLLI